MKIVFTIQQLNDVTKQLADEDKPAPDAPKAEWDAWRERWADGHTEVMSRMMRLA